MPRMLDAVYRALMNGEASPIAEADILAAARLVDQIVAIGERP